VLKTRTLSYHVAGVPLPIKAVQLLYRSTGETGAEKIGLIGYSGGAIATRWAAELASSYSPEISSRIVGAAMGGVLVDPAHNLRYVECGCLKPMSGLTNVLRGRRPHRTARASHRATRWRRSAEWLQSELVGVAPDRRMAAKRWA
jgi:hypothetical protein